MRVAIAWTASAERAMIAAGAGPSRAIATAVAISGGPMWPLPVRSATSWPASASPSRAASSPSGFQSSAPVPSTAAPTAAAKSTD